MAESVQTTLRLGAESLAQVKALAEREKRSLGAMVRILLDEALAVRAANELRTTSQANGG